MSFVTLSIIQPTHDDRGAQNFRCHICMVAVKHVHVMVLGEQKCMNKRQEQQVSHNCTKSTNCTQGPALRVLSVGSNKGFFLSCNYDAYTKD